MIEKLVDELKKDAGYYISWKANIAMAIYDEICKIDGFKSKIKLHKACNDGADIFLKRLIKE